MKKKLIAIALTLMITMSLTVPALAALVTDFTDVASNAWYYDYVRIACDKGLISGTSSTTFSPNDTMTRGQFVTVLGRYAGVDTGSVQKTGKFTDVPKDTYYTAYVYWANEKGIVYGTGDSTFAPDDNITKEQMVTLLVRYASNEGLTIPVDSSVSLAFGDAASISGYAKDSVETLKNAGVITGNEYGNFQPQKSISRAEATTMLVKLIAVIEEVDPDFIDCTIICATILNDDGYAAPKMTIWETKQIFVSYVPQNTTIDKTCTYVSGDTSILTVDDTGLVTAVAVGNGYVTVTSSNGLTDVCSIEVRGTEQKLTGYELSWGYEWNIGTYTDNDGVGYYTYEWVTESETTTMTREIGGSSGRMLLSPQAVYSDGYKQIILPESYGGYGFTFTSSNPSLVSINSSGAIIVRRVISADEEPQTVIITVYSSFFKTSKTVTITLYHQPQRLFTRQGAAKNAAPCCVI